MPAVAVGERLAAFEDQVARQIFTSLICLNNAVQAFDPLYARLADRDGCGLDQRSRLRSRVVTTLDLARLLLRGALIDREPVSNDRVDEG